MTLSPDQLAAIEKRAEIRGNVVSSGRIWQQDVWALLAALRAETERADKYKQAADRLSAQVDELEEAESRLIERADRLAEALSLAKACLPDPMHPVFAPADRERLVCAQIIMADALGDDDPGNVKSAREFARAALAGEDA